MCFKLFTQGLLLKYLCFKILDKAMWNVLALNDDSTNVEYILRYLITDFGFIL